MKRVIQNIRNGKLSLASLPEPLVHPGQVLIANVRSLISAGTEKMVMDLARKSLLGKARERPDHVRRVIEKMRNEGFFQTLSQVFAKLDEPMSMGYSSAGVVLGCGAGVQEFKPGDRVASNGPHAGVVAVPRHLCASLPAEVSFDQAAFTVLGAIALQGVRLSKLALGETAFVIGLGLLGQITVALLQAQGCRVIGTDLDPEKCELARRMGAEIAGSEIKADRIQEITRGLGADAVLITAATSGDGPVNLAAETVRKRGRIVAVGAVGLNLPRRPLYFKEAEFVVSCSYGPGRYDPLYEEKGQDYPAAYVRWTEQRNMQAILDLLGSGRIDLSPLISHHFPLERAEAAYEMIDKRSEPFLGILLDYPEPDTNKSRHLVTKATPAQGDVGISALGTGNFARMVLLPALKKCPGLTLETLCSAGGLTANHSADKLGFNRVTTNPEEVYNDERTKAIFVITRHDQHGEQVCRALKAGKHVFVEKPLALTREELFQVEESLAAAQDSGAQPLLMVGFNRRFSPAAVQVKEFFRPTDAPLALSFRFNAGPIPTEHWTQDELVGGGRIIGEACHAIDLATYLIGSPPIRVFAESIGGSNAPEITDDQCHITLRHANGSVSNIAYLSGGDKAFPKERIEVIGGGRVGVIEDFRQVITCSGGRRQTTKGKGQDKGHRGEISSFADALRQGGESPIPWTDLRAVSLAAILAVQSIREGVPFPIPGGDF